MCRARTCSDNSARFSHLKNRGVGVEVVGGRGAGLGGLWGVAWGGGGKVAFFQTVISRK